MSNKNIRLLSVVCALALCITGCSTKCQHISLISDAAVEPTCTEHGLTEGFHCSACGKIIVEQEIIEPLGHNVVIDEGYQPTCTSDGLTYGAHCSRCDTVLAFQDIIKHNGHDLMIDEAIAPTCTEHGLTEGLHCQVCGDIIQEQKIIEPLGHNIVIDKRVDPTATESGLTEGVHCRRCGTIIEEQNSIDPTGFKLCFEVNNDERGLISGETIQYVLQGKQSSFVEAIPYLGYRFVSWSNGVTENPIQITGENEMVLIANFEVEPLELPIMEIYTKNKESVISKDAYIKCNVSISNTDYKYELTNCVGKIKGRGNSTWDMPKKPYKLKFDNKIDLFGNGSAKTWTLIANYCDPSLARNFLAYEMGRLLGSDFCTTTQNIELFLNGEYQGVYLVCEQNEVAKNRVEIDKTYDTTNTGYLLELDERAPEEGVENKDWFALNNKTYAIKSPDPEESTFNEEFVNFIKEYLTQCYNAIIDKDIVKTTELIDLESFVKSYIVNEIMNCLDVGRFSFYLLKDKDGKLKSGPIWDYDISSGNYNYRIDNPDSSWSTIWAKKDNVWYDGLLEMPDFKSLVEEYLGQYYNDLKNTINSCVDFLKANAMSFNRNFQKWQTLGTYIWPNPEEIVAIETWEGQIEYLRSWVLKSLDYVIHYYTV